MKNALLLINGYLADGIFPITDSKTNKDVYYTFHSGIFKSVNKKVTTNVLMEKRTW